MSTSEPKLSPRIFPKNERSACDTPGVLRIERSLNTFHTFAVKFFGKIVVKKGTQSINVLQFFWEKVNITYCHRGMILGPIFSQF